MMTATQAVQFQGSLFFDDYEMRRLPVSAIEEENGGAENDCVYYFSVEFTE